MNRDKNISEAPLISEVSTVPESHEKCADNVTETKSEVASTSFSEVAVNCGVTIKDKPSTESPCPEE